MIASPALTLFERVEFQFCEGEREAFRDRPVPSHLEFAEAEIVVPFSGKGKFRRAYVPYLSAPRGPFEVADNAATRRIDYAAPPQSGKSLFGQVVHLRRIKYRPSYSFVILGDRKASGNVSRDYVQPLFESSPGLMALLPKNRDDKGQTRIVTLNGHRLYFAYASSISSAQTFPAETIICDERKDWPAGAEGKALQRLNQFPHTGLAVFISSLLDASGHWDNLAAAQDLRTFFIRCPVCGHLQVPVWGEKTDDHDDSDLVTPGIKFPSRIPEPDEIVHRSLAYYSCAGEGCTLDEYQFDQAVAAGEWRSVTKELLDPSRWENPHPLEVETPPLDPVSVGLLLPLACCSTVITMASMAAAFLKALRTPDPVAREENLKTWTNEYRNRPWLPKKKAAITKDTLAQHVGETPYGLVPEWAVVLVMQADTQDNGFWYGVRAFAADATSAGVVHGFLPKNLAGVSDREALKNILAADYLTPSGRIFNVRLGGIDHGGHRGLEVEEFCRELSGFCVPTKGSSTPIREKFKPFIIDKNPNTGKPVPGGLQGILFDPDQLKDQLLHRLSIPPGQPGSWSLPAGETALHAMHFTAESRDERTGKWTQIGSRANHLWDVAVGEQLLFAVLVNAGVVAALSAPAAPAHARPTPPASNSNRPLGTNPHRR